MALGHDVRVMPPAYVKPYVKRGKTDAADAEAISEAVTRPTMRFVVVKTREEQGVLILHKTRDLLVRQRTALINALRAHLGEYGIVTATGPGGVNMLTKLLREEQDASPSHARAALSSLVEQPGASAKEIDRLEGQILDWHRSDETSRRLATIPGIGPITASAIAAAVPDPGQFRSGRQFAAWLGLTPRPNSVRRQMIWATGCHDVQKVWLGCGHPRGVYDARDGRGRSHRPQTVDRRWKRDSRKLTAIPHRRS